MSRSPEWIIPDSDDEGRGVPLALPAELTHSTIEEPSTLHGLTASPISSFSVQRPFFDDTLPLTPSANLTTESDPFPTFSTRGHSSHTLSKNKPYHSDDIQSIAGPSRLAPTSPRSSHSNRDKRRERPRPRPRKPLSPQNDIIVLSSDTEEPHKPSSKAAGSIALAKQPVEDHQFLLPRRVTSPAPSSPGILPPPSTAYTTTRALSTSPVVRHRDHRRQRSKRKAAVDDSADEMNLSTEPMENSKADSPTNDSSKRKKKKKKKKQDTTSELGAEEDGDEAGQPKRKKSSKTSPPNKDNEESSKKKRTRKSRKEEEFISPEFVADEDLEDDEPHDLEVVVHPVATSGTKNSPPSRSGNKKSFQTVEVVLPLRQQSTKARNSISPRSPSRSPPLPSSRSEHDGLRGKKGKKKKTAPERVVQSSDEEERPTAQKGKSKREVVQPSDKNSREADSDDTTRSNKAPQTDMDVDMDKENLPPASKIPRRRSELLLTVSRVVTKPVQPKAKLGSMADLLARAHAKAPSPFSSPTPINRTSLGRSTLSRIMPLHPHRREPPPLPPRIVRPKSKMELKMEEEWRTEFEDTVADWDEMSAQEQGDMLRARWDAFCES